MQRGVSPPSSGQRHLPQLEPHEHVSLLPSNWPSSQKVPCTQVRPKDVVPLATVLSKAAQSSKQSPEKMYLALEQMSQMSSMRRSQEKQSASSHAHSSPLSELLPNVQEPLSSVCDVVDVLVEVEDEDVESGIVVVVAVVVATMGRHARPKRLVPRSTTPSKSEQLL